MLGNINEELQIGRAVALLGEKKVKELLWFHPKDPNIKLDSKIDKDLLFEDLLALYNVFRDPIAFTPEQILESYQDPNIITMMNLNKKYSNSKKQLEDVKADVVIAQKSMKAIEDRLGMSIKDIKEIKR